ELLAPGRPSEYHHAVKRIVSKMKPEIVLFTEYHFGNGINDPGSLAYGQEFVEYVKRYSKAIVIDLPYLLPMRALPAFGISHYLARGNTNLSVFSETTEKMLAERSRAIVRVEALQ
ncbi:hypothetical protein PFISCL1PPCAC_14324, partial [Pristionchus fissidentatus]